MLHIVEAAGADTADPVLRAMFAARKRVFVDLLKWDVPVIDGRFEVDQFDDEHATYLILSDGDGEHLGSARLLPTTRPHILGDLFPQLCAELPPRDAATVEITRFCLDRSLSARERRDVRDALVVALADHALETGISRYTAIAETSWVAQILAFGWECWPLGLPCIVAGEQLAALTIAIDENTRSRLTAAGIVDRLTADDDCLVAA